YCGSVILCRRRSNSPSRSSRLVDEANTIRPPVTCTLVSTRPRCSSTVPVHRRTKREWMRSGKSYSARLPVAGNSGDTGSAAGGEAAPGSAVTGADGTGGGAGAVSTGASARNGGRSGDSALGRCRRRRRLEGVLERGRARPGGSRRRRQTDAVAAGGRGFRLRPPRPALLQEAAREEVVGSSLQDGLELRLCRLQVAAVEQR